jgi:hypothetical protein
VAAGSNFDQKANRVSGYSGAAWYGRTMRGRNFSGPNSLMSETWPGAVNHGIHHSIQWDHALTRDPHFVFVCGWNEWTAMKLDWPDKVGGPVTFYDQCTQEYSRDIEPMRGGHGDNYYMQLADYIRKFKGTVPVALAGQPKTIGIHGDFSPWNEVVPVFRDYRGDTEHRKAPGYGKLVYTNNTGRNDLELLKLARDGKHLYFYARTVKPITPRTDPQWMRLLIDVDGDRHNGWHGFDFMVNRESPASATRATLEQSLGGWKWKAVAQLEYHTAGRELHLAVQRSVLGIETDPVDLRFKWADSNLVDGDMMSTYTDGDAAPDGRFSYVYCTKEPAPAPAPGRRLPVAALQASGAANPDMQPDKAGDGKPGTFWSSRKGDIADQKWLLMDLGGARQVAGLRLVPRKVGRIAVSFPRDFRIQFRTGKETWNDVPGQSYREHVTPVAPVPLRFEKPVHASAIRILATKLRTDDSGRNYSFQLAEVEAFGN